MNNCLDYVGEKRLPVYAYRAPRGPPSFLWWRQNERNPGLTILVASCCRGPILI
jgi:hypothetical protein